MGKIFPFVLIIITHLTRAQDDQSLIQSRSHSLHEWSYSGEYGASHWAELDPEYMPCQGIHQSPINIVPDKAQDANLDIEFHYHSFLADLVNNGHTLIERIIEPRALTFNHEDYTLLQFHFHTPSEHHVMGKEYPMEIHFVHQNAAGRYTVVAVLIEEGSNENRFLLHFMNVLPTHVNEEIRSKERADPIETFPAHPEDFYYYDGSFTTPPCTEGVNWIVLREPVQAKREQIEAIHEIIHDDNRPIQELNDRVLFHAGN